MTEHDRNAAAYWSANLRLIVGSLIVWALVSYGGGFYCVLCCLGSV